MERQTKKIHRSSVRLTTKQLRFLKGLSNRCRRSGGKKFSRGRVIQVLVSISKELNIDIVMIKSENELRKRIVKAFCKYS